MKYIRYILPNNLKVIICPMQHVKSVSIGIWVGVGGRYENDEENGIAHFLEHMLFKGTHTQTAMQITQSIEGVGGNMNAFTSEEYTCYYAKVPCQHTEKALSVLCDMYQDPLLKNEHIKKEKEVILEELKMHVDMPSQHVYDLLSQTIWPSQPLGRILVGTEKTINGITRRDLTRFHNQYYNASNTVVSISGAVEPGKIMTLIRRKFSKINKGKKYTFDAVREDQQKPRLSIKTHQTQQCHICVGLRALPRSHPERFAFRLMNVILGENMSSRLFQEVRERRGLSYDISSSIERFKDTGTLMISGGTDAPRLPRTLKCIFDVLYKMKKKGVTADELKRAKEYLSGQLSLSMERTTNQMIYAGECEIVEDKIMKLEDILKAIRKVNTENVKRICEVIFQDNRLNMALIGPVEDKGLILKTLHIGG
ncbi:MAG: pitrilysin family protein [Chlamydiota bacterium]|nr:pitrilysin family protein [Chlamydiota bacterium]